MLDSSFLLSRITPAWGRTVGKMHPFLVVSERVRVSSGEGAPGPGRLPPSGFRQLFLFCWLKLFLYCGDVTGGFWGPEKLGQMDTRGSVEKDSTLDEALACLPMCYWESLRCLPIIRCRN